MVEIYKWPLSKAALSSLSRDERILFFLAGQVANQMALLLRLLQFSTNAKSEHPVEIAYAASQSYLLVLPMIGTLNEGYEVVRTRFLAKKQLSEKLLPLLTDEGKTALDWLKKYFGKKANLINKLRSSYAFHHPTDDDLEAAFAEVPENEQWDLYLSQLNVNTLYLACQLVTGYGALQAVGATDPMTAFGKMVQEAMAVADRMHEFMDACMQALTPNLEPVDGLGEPVLTVTNAPDFRGYVLPAIVDATPPAGEPVISGKVVE